MRKRFLTICLAAAAITANALTLDGKCQIVIPENANVQEKYAAGELSKYLGRVLGAEIKQSTEDKFSGGQAIYLGDTKAAKTEGFEQFAVEEYAIKSKGDNVVIAGSKLRGLLYGSYDFLERFAGVRFFTLTCERVPKQSSINVPDDLSIRRKPAFEFRQLYTGTGHFGWYDIYRPKLRCNVGVYKPELGGSEGYGSGGAGHSYYRYSKDFPKEISWMDPSGERCVVNDAHRGSICFSHPEVLRRFTEKLKGLIESDRKNAVEKGLPAPRFYAIQQNDCNATCYCSECLAFKEKHGLSGLVIDFSNKLADNIKDEYPEIYLLIFAYYDTLEPPISDIRPRSNVLPQLTTLPQPYHDHLRAIDDPVNAKASELFDKWAGISDNLAMWDYWRYFGSFVPPCTPVKNLAGMMKKYRQCKVKFFFAEYEPGNKVLLSFFDLTCYVGFRLLDNPDLDYEVLIDEFMAEYYGAAAPYMRRYLDFLTEKFRMCGNVVEERIAYNKRKYLNDRDFYKESLDLLTQAENAVVNSDNGKVISARIRVETLLLLSAYLKIYLKNNSGATLEMNGAPLSAELAKKTIEDIAPDAASVYLHPNERTEQKLKALKTYYTSVNFLKPTQEIPPKALDALPEGETRLYAAGEFKTSAASKIDDQDAPKGTAYSLASYWSKEENAKNHDKPFQYGIYEQAEKHNISTCAFTAEDIPQDEKYHWYYAGRTPMYSTMLAHIHWTWILDSWLCNFYDENETEQEYDVYLLIKLQGPAYVKGSKSQNDVRLAETALLKINN